MANEQNQVQIGVSTVFDPSGLDESKRSWKQAVQEFETDADRLARAGIERQRAHRTGEGTEQADTAYAERLRRQGEEAQKLVETLDNVKNKRADLERQLKDFEASGVRDPKRQMALIQELQEAIAQDDPAGLRRGQRVALRGLADVETRERREEQERQRTLADIDAWERRAQSRAREARRFQTSTDAMNDDTMRQEREDSERRVEERKDRYGRIAATVGSVGLFQALRGMPLAEEAAALRYRIGAPGTQGGVEQGLIGRVTGESSIDTLGKQISETGRAMHYSRVETLRAADAYSQAAGRLGKELVPEVEHLARAARFLRMDFSEAGQFFGGLRRMTREDDPAALQRIVTTVTNMVQAAGPRGDEIKQFVTSLNARIAQGNAAGMSAENLQIHDALLRIISQSGLPGFQGERGLQKISGAFQLGINPNDMNDVIRYRLLTGTEDQLSGNPFAVRGRVRLDLERFKRGQIDEGMLDRYFAAFQKAGEFGGGDEVGQADAIQQILGIPVSLDDIMNLRKSAMGPGGREALRDKLKEVSSQPQFVGPDAEQLKTTHMANQESIRKTTDAIEGLGAAATHARNALYGIGGGGQFGDYFALTMQGLAGVGGLSMLGRSMGWRGNVGRLRGLGGWVAGMGRSIVGRFGGGGTTTAFQRALAATGAEVGAASRGGSRALAVGEAAMAAGSRFGRLGGLARVGGRAAPWVGATLGAIDIGRLAHGSVRLWQERGEASRGTEAAERMAGRVFGDQDARNRERLLGYDDPSMAEEARKLYEQRRGETKTVTSKTSGVGLMPAMPWELNFAGWKLGEKTKSEQREEQVTPGGAFDYTEQEMKRRHPGASLRDIRPGFGVAENRKDELKVTLDVNLKNQNEIAKAVADRAGEVLGGVLQNIYSPTSYGRNPGGAPV